MADREQHIDTLARAMCKCHPAEDDSLHCSWWRAAALFDSLDPTVHDALTAALHANADRARVLAAHADHGWLREEPGVRVSKHIEVVDWWTARQWAAKEDEVDRNRIRRRYVSEWEAQQ